MRPGRGSARREQGSARREQGSVSLLLVGFFLVAVLLVTVVVDASVAFLRRQELAALADGAAVAAADGIRSEQIYLEGVPDQVAIDAALARAYVADVTPPRRLAGVECVEAGADGGGEDEALLGLVDRVSLDQQPADCRQVPLTLEHTAEPAPDVAEHLHFLDPVDERERLVGEPDGVLVAPVCLGDQAAPCRHQDGRDHVVRGAVQAAAWTSIGSTALTCAPLSSKSTARHAR